MKDKEQAAWRMGKECLRKFQLCHARLVPSRGARDGSGDRECRLGRDSKGDRECM